MSLKIIFAGTPRFAVPIFRALIDSSHRVLAVYTQPDRPTGRGRKIMESPIKTLAQQHAITVIQPIFLRDEEEKKKLVAMSPDVMVVVAYGLILPPLMLNSFRFGCVNVHASLLPRWRGAAPVQRAILAGDRETGVSIILMDKDVDTGDVLARKSCPILSDDTAANLYDRLSLISTDLLLDLLKKLEKGDVQLEKQDKTLVTYASKIQKREVLMNWKKSAAELVRQIHAFNPTPVAFTYFAGGSMRIWQARALNKETDLKPGTLVSMNKKGIYVSTGSGILQLCQVQFPGRRVCSANDFINAYGNQLIPKQTVFG